MQLNKDDKNNHYKNSNEAGLGLLGLLFVISLIVGAAFLVLNIYPIMSEKMKVDMVLESVSANPQTASMSLQKIASTMEKQLSINYVTSLNKKSILKGLTMKNTKEGKKISFEYKIHREMLEKWRVVHDYQNTVFISRDIQ